MQTSPDAKSWRKVVKHAGVIIRANNRVLIVQGIKSKLWGFPKGLVEPSENIADAAIRELKEETGLVYTAKDLGRVFVVRANESKHSYFEIKIDRMVKIAIQKSEIIDYDWWDLNKPPNFPLSRASNEIINVLHTEYIEAKPALNTQGNKLVYRAKVLPLHIVA